MAPAARPATPANQYTAVVSTGSSDTQHETRCRRMPSLAPNTAARSQPLLPDRCYSFWSIGTALVSLPVVTISVAAPTIILYVGMSVQGQLGVRIYATDLRD